MCMGSVLKHLPPTVCIDGNNIGRVDSFKLLGVIVSNTLNWEEHVAATCVKANKRLHFLKLLKRSSMSPTDLLQYYKTIIRSVIEYACPVWQSSLTADQRNRLESIQRRAVRIISGSSDYELYCVLYELEPIAVRLDRLAQTTFLRLCNPSDCLHRLIPVRQSTETLDKLRYKSQLSNFFCRTERFKNSFLPYALSHY